MQNTSNHHTTPKSEGETILFYGEFASISADTQMKGGAIDSFLLLDAVKEHKDDRYLTVMDTDYISLSSELKQEVSKINPNTQFIQAHTLEEFAEYYDKGMDRKVHPVDNVITIDSVMFYDTIEKEQPEVQEQVSKPKEYIKATDISTHEILNDLSSQMNMVTHLKGQEFLDFMGLKGYDADDLLINIAKINLSKEFFKKYSLPQAGKTAVESIEKVIPSMPAKSIKEGVMDGIEFVHDIVADKDKGTLKIEFECHNNDISDCHIKGVYREYAQDNVETKESTVENIKVDESGKAVYEHESNITIEQNATDTYTQDLNDSNDYVMEM